MIEHWSSAKVQVYLEEKDKEIESLEEAVVILTQQRNEEEKRTEQCVKFLLTLLHPEEMGWAVSQEVREQAKQTLINIDSTQIAHISEIKKNLYSKDMFISQKLVPLSSLGP